MKQPKLSNKEQYIGDIMMQSNHKDTKELMGKNIVSIDPGKCDLLYCVNGSNKDAKTFRYSQENATRQI